VQSAKCKVQNRFLIDGASSYAQNADVSVLSEFRFIASDGVRDLIRYPSHRVGRFLLIISSLAFLGLCSRITAGFQAPLTSVETWLTTNGYAVTVHYRVFDPDVAAWKESQRRYDGSSLAYWSVQGLAARDGVVAWRASAVGQFASHDTEAGFAIYDPAHVAWMQGGRIFSGDAAVSWVISGFNNSGGVVLWQVSPTGPFAEPTTEIHYATYDPSRGAWRLRMHSYAGTAVSFWSVSKLVVVNGTVAWQANAGGQFATPDAEVGFTIYDPGQGIWIEGTRRYGGGTFDSWILSGLTLADGLVARTAAFSGQSSTVASEVGFTLYDPSRASWMTNARRYDGNTLDHWTVTNFVVGNQRVQWTALRSLQSINEVRGYDQRAGSWYAGPNKPLAWFQTSTLAGGAPLRVWLGDLSIGATAWKWDMGDGATNSQRSPYHVFTQAGIFTISETISGPGGGSKAAHNVTVFGQGPLRFETVGAQPTNGEFHMRLDGLTGRTPLVLWASTDLRTWQAVLANPPTLGSIQLVDVITNFPARFYRAVEQP